MGNACQPFGFSIDDGTKAFCVAEMCIGIFHLIMTSMAYDGYEVMNYYKHLYGPSDNFGFSGYLVMGLFLILAVALFVQFVMGLLLYFLGYKKRNMTICLVWIVVACVNFALLWLLLVFGLIFCNGGKVKKCNVLQDHGVVQAAWFYLLYIILGVWIVIVYMKWARSTGVAVEYSATPAGQPTSSQSHRSAKVANQDNEA